MDAESPDVKAGLAVNRVQSVVEKVFHPVVLDKTQYDENASVFAFLDAAEKALEADRKDLVDDLNKTVRKINDRFRPTREAIQARKLLVKGPMENYLREEDRNRREAEDAARKQRDAELAEIRQKEEAERQRLEAAKREEDAARLAAEPSPACRPLAAFLAKKEAEARASETEVVRQSTEDAIRATAMLERAPLVVDAPPAPVAAGVRANRPWKWRLKDFSKVADENKILNEVRINGLVRALKGDAQAQLGDGIEVFQDVSIGGR